METRTFPFVVVARITKPHATRGEVVLESLSDVEGRLENTPAFLLIDKGIVIRKIEVESRRFFGGRNVLKFRGIDDMTGAEGLRGLELAVPESEIGQLPPDTYFIHQLVGSSVCLKDGTPVGLVQRVIETGGQFLLEVGEGEDILIPFVAQICLEVDPVGGKIVIDPPEGLLRLNAR
jgi:16S rRNA processing protein RimM